MTPPHLYPLCEDCDATICPPAAGFSCEHVCGASRVASEATCGRASLNFPGASASGFFGRTCNSVSRGMAVCRRRASHGLAPSVRAGYAPQSKDGCGQRCKSGVAARVHASRVSPLESLPFFNAAQFFRARASSTTRSVAKLSRVHVSRVFSSSFPMPFIVAMETDHVVRQIVGASSVSRGRVSLLA